MNGPKKWATINVGWGVWLVILSFPMSILGAGYHIGQMNANGVWAQFEAQKQLQAEFVEQIKAAGLRIEEGPAVPPATKG